MRSNIVEYVTTEKMDIRIPLQDAFYFEPKGRFIWLQKLAWRFISKQKSLKRAHTFKTDYKINRIDTQDFIKNLLTQHGDLFNNYGKQPKKLLIGHKNLQDLMKQVYDRSQISFTSCFYTNDLNGTKIMALKSR